MKYMRSIEEGRISHADWKQKRNNLSSSRGKNLAIDAFLVTFTLHSSESTLKYSTHLINMPVRTLARLKKVEHGGHATHDGNVPVGAHAQGKAKEIVTHPGKRHLVRQGSCATQQNRSRNDSNAWMREGLKGNFKHEHQNPFR